MGALPGCGGVPRLDTSMMFDAGAASDRRVLVSGNWKMNHDHLAAIRTVQALGLMVPAGDLRMVEVSIHPPFTALRSVQTVIEADDMPFSLGAQNCHVEDAGAFTGEVSAAMLAKLHVEYVIVGHSERRTLSGETDEVVRAKLDAVLRNHMRPITCVGETLDERERGSAADRIEAQVTAAVEGLPEEAAARLVLAYEPIWAIGTGLTPSVSEARQACDLIRSLVAGLSGDGAARAIRIQYGGSVSQDNAREMLVEAGFDGVLVGGASLDATSFAAIIAAAAARSG